MAAPASLPGEALSAALQRRLALAIDPMVGSIRGVQARFFVANGRYWQGLITHDRLPEDEQERVPTQYDRAPTDQPGLTWRSQGLPALFPRAYPFAIQVHVYDGPTGQGFAIELRIAMGKQVWRRVIQRGPERSREREWARYDLGEKG